MIGAALLHAPNFTFAALSWLEFAAYFVPFLQASALSRLTMVRCWVLLPYLPSIPLCGSLRRIFNALLGSMPGLFYVGLLIVLAQGAFALLGLQLWAGLMLGGCGWPQAGGVNNTDPAAFVTQDAAGSLVFAQQACALPPALQPSVVMTV